MPGNGTRLFEELMRFRPDGMTANSWVVKAGVSRNFWNDLKRHGNPSRRTLEKLLAAADSSLAEFEALRSNHPKALGENRQATRFLCGLASPAVSAAKLTKHDLFGVGERTAFADALAAVTARGR